MRYMPHALAAMAVVLCAALCMAFAEKAEAYPGVTWSSVNDRPLLESVEQVRDARLHGWAEFRIGNELFVVFNLPSEYVDYSAKCVRMP